jgi:4-hydroxy-3-methylbut-2-enyl diphosphate reductase
MHGFKLKFLPRFLQKAGGGVGAKPPQIALHSREIFGILLVEVSAVGEHGFCFGVKAAVHKAWAQVEAVERGEVVYLYGDLVNNEQVMARFLGAGFVVAESVEEIVENSTVVIRAHGVGKAVYAALEAKNARIIDCTCVKVKKIHEIVSGKKNVIIVGKKNHPEVTGILGWCENGRVVESVVVLAEPFCAQELCVVAQTTCKKNLWEKAVEKIKEKAPNAEIHDTLCDVIEKRVENAVETAKKADCMVVVGDKKSANSVELFEACKAVCERVYFVAELADLLEDFSGEGKIKVVGSASAPSDVIDEIADFVAFMGFFSGAKAEIEAASEGYLQGQITAARGKLFIEKALRDLHHQNHNGKRIRGAMIKLGEKIAGGEGEFLQIAMAYEIFQTAILIHDDVIDKSSTRRGKTTIHAGESDAHFGASRAICIGDYGLFLANKILAESGLEAEKLVRILRLFADIQLKTLEGEIMDVSLPVFPINIKAEYEKYTNIVLGIYEYKTAWYTLAGPAMLGAIIGGASDEQVMLLRDIMLPLGMAFQIKDDLLGIFANEKVLGKPALSDIIEKKQTILYGYAVHHATPEQLVVLGESYGSQSASGLELDLIRQIFTETGAKKYALDEIERLSQNALRLITNINKEQQPLLRGLVHYLTTRRY